MTESDEELLKIYMIGWNQCYGGLNFKALFEVPLQKRAYQLGWDDYIIGDDVSSNDAQTEEEILNKIKKYAVT